MIKCTIQSTRKIWKLDDDIFKGLKYKLTAREDTVGHDASEYLYVMSQDFKMSDSKWCIEIHRTYRG